MIKYNKKDNVKDNRLGGHKNKTWTDKGALIFLKTTFEIKTMLDIGCGPGGMREIAESNGIQWTGIEGDVSVASRNVIIHNFNLGPLFSEEKYDLGWSVEFLEHVEEKFIDNYMSSFSRCSHVWITAAPPGSPGHHHVNCRPITYWIDIFSNYGFQHDELVCSRIKKASTMKAKKGNKYTFVDRGSMYFRKIK